MHTHTLAHTDTHTHAYKYTHTHLHAYIQAQHTHTCTHTHTLCFTITQTIFNFWSNFSVVENILDWYGRNGKKLYQKFRWKCIWTIHRVMCDTDCADRRTGGRDDGHGQRRRRKRRSTRRFHGRAQALTGWWRPCSPSRGRAGLYSAQWRWSLRKVCWWCVCVSTSCVCSLCVCKSSV